MAISSIHLIRVDSILSVSLQFTFCHYSYCRQKPDYDCKPLICNCVGIRVHSVLPDNLRHINEDKKYYSANTHAIL